MHGQVAAAFAIEGEKYKKLMCEEGKNHDVIKRELANQRKYVIMMSRGSKGP